MVAHWLGWPDSELSFFFRHWLNLHNMDKICTNDPSRSCGPSHITISRIYTHNIHTKGIMKSERRFESNELHVRHTVNAANRLCGILSHRMDGMDETVLIYIYAGAKRLDRGWEYHEFRAKQSQYWPGKTNRCTPYNVARGVRWRTAQNRVDSNQKQ